MSDASHLKRKLTKQILYDQWQREFSQPAGMMFGKTYFVSDSGSASNDGLSPDQPKALISEAVTLSDATIVENYDRRNQIFLLGGAYNEAVVAMPKACDVIGLGGYYSGYPVNIGEVWTIATAAVGTHIHGLHFSKNSATTILSIPDGSNWFHLSECLFYAGGSCSKALEFTGTTYYMNVEKNRFVGTTYAYGIYINGNPHCGVIEKNYIYAKTAGIYLKVNANTKQLLIKENVIDGDYGGAQLPVGIDKQTEASIMIVGNWISAVDAIYGTGIGGMDSWCIGNWVTEAGTADWEKTPD